MSHIFISYAKKDTRPLAEALDAALNSIDGLTAWMDRSLQAGQNWPNEIQQQINKADLVVVLLSDDVNRPETPTQSFSFVLNEISHALTKRKTIVPVLIHDIDIPIDIIRLHRIDLRDESDNPQPIVNDICQRFNIAKPIEVLLASPPTFIPQKSQKITATISSATQINYSDEVKAAIDRAYNFKGKRNSDWTPFVTTFPDLKIPDMRFCLVPVGRFMMGSNQFADERPRHPQTFNQPFWISQYPITNAQWSVAVEADVIGEPEGGSPRGWYRDPSMQNAPVIGISWDMAYQFAEWLGCHLPTEHEWEYAARGIESLNYPWGHIWDESKPVWRTSRPADVETNPEGSSWVDAQHLIGNVWEWTASIKGQYPYPPDGSREKNDLTKSSTEYVLRGGAWSYTSEDHLRAACRKFKPMIDANSIRGFRIALTVKPKEQPKTTIIARQRRL